REEERPTGKRAWTNDSLSTGGPALRSASAASNEGGAGEARSAPAKPDRRHEHCRGLVPDRYGDREGD
ncbi:hypothetical protein THAOC_18038, partial [Thalassiosira oceanica]